MLLHPRFLPAEPVAVRHIEGTVHGFLTLRTMEGETLAAGDLIQITRGSQVASRLVFRFRNGSVDDETATFTQRDPLRLVSDNHLQQGPAFPHPMDVLDTASTGEVTVRFADDQAMKTSKQASSISPPIWPMASFSIS
jgi:hypothetical protein